MRKLLIALFSAIFIWMIVMTTMTSIKMNITESFPLFASNPWALATLWDAYFGFLTFYVWVAWREPGMVARVVWFVLVMCLGNIAMSGYMLIQLFRMSDGEPMEALMGKRGI